jgi:hypothetical protein
VWWSMETNSSILIQEFVLEPLRRASNFFKSTFDDLIQKQLNLANFSNSSTTTWLLRPILNSQSIQQEDAILHSKPYLEIPHETSLPHPSASSSNPLLEESIWSFSPLSFLASWYFISLLAMVSEIIRFSNEASWLGVSEFNRNLTDTLSSPPTCTGHRSQ